LWCRGHLAAAKALLRAGADPNYMNNASDLTLFWGIDGGVEMIKLLHQYGVELSKRTPKDWTPLSYAKAKGKYGATEEKGIYPEVMGYPLPSHSYRMTVYAELGGQTPSMMT